MRNTFECMVRSALDDSSVVIDDQICEKDKVSTRKGITGRHSGTLPGIEATGLDVSIGVIDIVRFKGRYVEHRGVNTLGAVLAQLGSGTRSASGALRV